MGENKSTSQRWHQKPLWFFSAVAHQQYPASRAKQGGFALLSIAVICIVIGALALSSMLTTTKTEQIASSSIQRTRVLQAAVGGSVIAERELEAVLVNRVFADSIASEGIFSNESVQEAWWNNTTYTGEQNVPGDSVIGVKAQPRFILEEIGSFSSDGGSGINNLDRGSGAYGNLTSGGREFAVYKTVSAAVGPQDNSRSIIETVFVTTY